MPSPYVCAKPAGGPGLAGAARAPPLLRAATFFFPPRSPLHLTSSSAAAISASISASVFSWGALQSAWAGSVLLEQNLNDGGGGRREGGELRCDAGQGGRGKCGRAERTRRGARARPGPSPCSPIPLTRARPRPGLPPRTPGCGATGSTCRTPPRSWRATLEGRRAGILVQKKGARGRGRRRGVCVGGGEGIWRACMPRRGGGAGGAGREWPGPGKRGVKERERERGEKTRSFGRGRASPSFPLPQKIKNPSFPSAHLPLPGPNSPRAPPPRPAWPSTWIHSWTWTRSWAAQVRGFWGRRRRGARVGARGGRCFSFFSFYFRGAPSPPSRPAAPAARPALSPPAPCMVMRPF